MTVPKLNRRRKGKRLHSLYENGSSSFIRRMLNQAQLHGSIRNGLRWSQESIKEVLLEGERPTSPSGFQTIPTWREPLSVIGAPFGERELQRWLFTAASTLALHQNAIVRLKLDYPDSLRAWLLKPGRKPVRVYRPEQVRCPFIELRVNARSWLPALKLGETKAAQASRQLEKSFAPLTRFTRAGMQSAEAALASPSETPSEPAKPPE